MRYNCLHMKRVARRGLLVVAAIVALFFVRAFTDRLTLDIPKQLQDFMTFATSILVESLPFVLLGIFISIAVQIWLPQGFITRYLPKKGIARRLYISCFGVFLPVCECGNLPLARGLIARGLTPAESMTFLLAAPILNPITLITTQQAFPSDPHIMIARAVGALVIANFVGWVFSKHLNQESLLQPHFAATCKADNAEHAHHQSRTSKSLTLLMREAAIILPALFIGAALAGAIQVLVPRDVLLSVGTDPVTSIAVMMTLAFVVAICSNVDAFFALSFSSTFSIGSIVSFLVFGPMIDIKMISLMRTTYTTKTIWYTAILVGTMSILLGLGVNYAF